VSYLLLLCVCCFPFFHHVGIGDYLNLNRLTLLDGCALFYHCLGLKSFELQRKLRG